MKVLIDKQRVIEIWKKSGHNHQPLLYEDFKNSINKLAVASFQHQCALKKKLISNLNIA